MQEKAERNAEHLPIPPMTSPSPSQGGEVELAEPPPPPPKEGSANLRNLPRPLPRRGDLTCKEISYNSLRNYALYIVNYELTTIQHSTFNIKNYAL